MEFGIRPRALMGALLALIVAAAASPAAADWYKAETDRFIVYGEGREAKVREYALKLQTFDAVLRIFHPSTADRTPATKLQLYLVKNQAQLRRVRPNLVRDTAGFYAAMNEGVFATAVTGTPSLEPEHVLFHEYAHHFMLENFPTAYPAWFVEGFAEYFMTAEITPTGVKVGGYSDARAYGIFNQSWLPWEEVLSKTTAETRRQKRNVFYSQAWLLTHYMRSDPERAAQLNRAIADIAAGKEPLEAFHSATGMTSDQLTDALKKYRKLLILHVPEPLKTEPVITVTRLPASADDFLLENLRLILSPTGRTDAEFLGELRRRAARYPGDALAETTLARAEFVMGDVAAAEAIMKRRLEAQPDDAETLLLAGTGQVLAGLRDKEQREQRYRAARPLFAKAYALDKNDFRPLYAYALARSIEPGYPTENDLNALIQARALAPAVQENSLRAGLALLQLGRKEDAARVLAAVINNPHGGAAARQARALLTGDQAEDAEADEDEVDEETASQAKAG